MVATTADIRDTARHAGASVGNAARTVGNEVRDGVREAAREVKDQALNTADQARTSLTANYEQLKRELDVLRGQLVAIGSDASEEAKLRLASGLQTLTTRADTMSREARVYGGHKLEEAERIVQERPLTSVLVSFGLGMLFAQFIRR
jgi:ElaB/YqjD/DUF883 family membrane-anchored ribosome-binding protein